MSKQAKLVMSSQDFDRIEALLASLPPSAPVGKALEAELGRAKVVPPEKIPPTVVTMNSTVRFLLVESGEEFSLTLVYPKDVEGKSDRISILAPVGIALLGLSVGDELEWPRPGGGVSTVKVEEIVYQPERAGELHR